MVRLELFSKNELQEIHLTSLDALKEIGVIIPHDEVLRKLDELGAEVDYKNKHVRIPHYLAEEAIRKTPRSDSPQMSTTSKPEPTVEPRSRT